MKQILLTTLLIAPQIVGAMVCENATQPLQEEYYNQKQWEEVQVATPIQDLMINGMVTLDNELHITDLSGYVNLSTQIDVDSKNQGYEQFKFFCKNAENLGHLLSNQRLAKNDNRYTIEKRYLPRLDEYSNSPLTDFTNHNIQLHVTYEDTAIVNKALDSSAAKRKFYQSLNSQIQSQGLGALSLDLTNWDDFACDLLYGKIEIRIIHRFGSVSPLVSQRVNFPEADFTNLLSTWSKALAVEPSKERALFTAGVLTSEMLNEGQIESSLSVKIMELVDTFFQKDPLTSFEKWTQEEVSCLFDGIQEYRKPLLNHVLTTVLEFDAMDTFYEKGEQ